MKRRLDQIVVEREIAPSRNAAQAMIMAGKIKAGTRVLDKPGQKYDISIELTVDPGSKYVSRAGDKLASVAKSLQLDFNGKVVVDVGSSTGGFTDFSLQNGATRVICVDVGNAQLAYRLRQDPRVVVMERTDIRDIEELPERPDMAVIDVSFISLTKILGHVLALIKPGGLVVAMAKPQFEAGKATADKFKGVIDDETVRLEILSELETYIKAEFEILARADSAVAGARGNHERFYAIVKTDGPVGSI